MGAMDGEIDEGKDATDGGGCGRMDGVGKRERESEARLHSWEMRMVTMATAAESHMMRRSEREKERCERAKKELEREGGACQQTTEEERKGMVMR